MPTVHASPDYRIPWRGDPPTGYPAQRLPLEFRADPADLDWDERRAEFLAHCLQNPAPQNAKSAFYELARLQAGGQPHEGILHGALDFVDERRDCADFVFHSILRLIYQFEGCPGLSEKIQARARRTALDFKYWPDEPGQDHLCTWTENHQILFASAAYLMGQRFPDAVFTNSKHSGWQKMALNRPRILRWLDLRFRTGFSEWLSHVYYDEDITALLSLVDFAEDEEIRRKARAVLELLFLDIALNLFKGVFASTHGRSYENTKKWPANEGTTDLTRLAFGVGAYSAFDNMSAVALALSQRFRLPEVIRSIALDRRHAEIESFQRMGILLKQAENWGLGFENFEDGMVYLSLEAYLHPRTARLTLKMMDAFDWWENRFLSPLKPFRRLLRGLDRLELLPVLLSWLEWDACRNTREQVNIYTYRTPDLMLSSAQDYRKGYGGDQQHIWQASLGPGAVCFTTHPARLDGASPNYWEGSGCLPRVGQVKNVAIVIYQIHSRPGLYVSNSLHFTHAWLPRDQFDEVVERRGWVFARKSDGYLALRSCLPYRWQDQPGEDFQREMISIGRRNAWICEMGSRSQDGEFEVFQQRLETAPVHFEGLQVTYGSPSQGDLQFAWDGDLLQNGNPVALSGYPRYASPYAHADFPSDRVEIICGPERRTLEL